MSGQSNETQHDGTSVCTDPVIHRSHLVSEILKLPALSLCNTPPSGLMDFNNRHHRKRWVLYGSFSTGMNWLSNETQLMKPGWDGTSVSLNPVTHRSHSLPKVCPPSLCNTKTPARIDSKDRVFSKLRALHDIHSKGLNQLGNETAKNRRAG